MKKLLSLGLLATLISTNSLAVLDIEIPFVITPTKTAQSMDDTLVPMVVVTREEIEASSATDVAEILQFYAGLDIARTGGNGAQTSLFIRGTESDHILVLIDGVKINPATLGQPALQNISPEMIERIEVVKGPRSSLYGSSAIGGVINIITRKAKKGFSVNVATGSNETNQLSLSGGFKLNGFDGIVAFDKFKTAGYLDKTASNKEHASDNQSLQFRIGKDINDIRIELVHLQNDGAYEYESFGSELEQKHDNKVTSIKYKNKIAKNWETQLSYSIMQDHISQVKSADNAFTDRNAIDWQNNIQLGKHQLVAGLSLENTKVDSLSFGTTIDKESSEKSFYIQDALAFGVSQFIVALRATDHDVWGTNSTYNFDYGLKLSQKIKLTAGVGTGFKAPSFTDLYGFGGNINLKPEKSLSKEVGVRYQISKNQNISINLFDNEIEDLIFAKATFSNTNIEKAKIVGADIQYAMRKGNWNINAGLVLQDPQDVTNNVVLSRRAKKSFTLNSIYHLDKIVFGAKLIAVGERDDSYYSATTLDAYNLVNLNMSYVLNKAMSISGAIGNVFGEEYETASGYPGKDRNILISFKYQQ